MKSIALVVIAYNRKDSLHRLLQSLDNAIYDEVSIPLYISIDKSNTDEVERFADEHSWRHGKKTVVKHERNLGLRAHVLEQGRLLDEYDAIVILEDDLVVSPYFWTYTQQTVEKYFSCDNVAGISLYSFAVNYHLRSPFIPLHDGHDAYFMNCAMSWGQVWMKRQWKEFEQWYKQHLDFTYMPNLPKSICSWSEKSWLKYHTRYCIETNKYFVFPYVSYTTNFSEPGTHIRKTDTIFQVPILAGDIKNLRLPDIDDNCIKYDGWFENKALYDCLRLKESECCLDLNSTNGNTMKKRYWLTTRRLPYKVVANFGYTRRPIEKNVLEGCHGLGIYLYDTTVKSHYPQNQGNPSYLATHFIQNSFLFIRDYGFRNFFNDFIQLFKAKYL